MTEVAKKERRWAVCISKLREGTIRGLVDNSDSESDADADPSDVDERGGLNGSHRRPHPLKVRTVTPYATY